MADWTSTTDYRGGLLGWNSFVQPYGNVNRQAMEIPLWLKEYSVPIRKKASTEINTVDIYEPGTEKSIGTQVIIDGSPELSTVSISGFVKTPIDGFGYYRPVDKVGAIVIPMYNMTYAEIIGMYIEGSMDLSVGKAFRRRDPDYFISPYGQKYSDPVILTWDVAAVSDTPGKQSVSGTLALER